MPLIVHSTLSGSELHVPGYKQNTDPGAVGAGIEWIDTSGPTFVYKSRNATNTGWDVIGGVSGTFTTDLRISVPYVDGQPFSVKLTNLSSSVVEPEIESRKQLDFTNVSQVRTTAFVISSSNPSNPGAAVGFQFSLDGGNTWAFLDGLSGPTASFAQTGSQITSYTNITGTAQTDILTRWVTLGGDGTSAPILGSLSLGLRMTQIGIH